MIPDKPWYETAFGSFYDILYPHRSDEAAEMEIEDLARILGLRGTEKVLDVGCGNGRHLAAMAARVGLLAGADLSPELLQCAAGRGELSRRLVRADLRALPFRGGFDLVLNLFTSFGYFQDPGENRRALSEMARVLSPGGRLVLDHINRIHLLESLVPETVDVRGDWSVSQKRAIRDDRVEKAVTAEHRNGTRFSCTESVRLYTESELTDLLKTEGLTVFRAMGSFDGKPFEAASPRMILICRREGG